MMMMAITQAKTGRSMKNLAMRALPYFPAARAAARRRGRGRRAAEGHGLDRRSRPDPLQPLEDHAVARREPVAHQPLVAEGPVDLQRAGLHLLVGADHHGHGLALRVARDAPLRHEDRALVLPLLDDRRGRTSPAAAAAPGWGRPCAA